MFRSIDTISVRMSSRFRAWRAVGFGARDGRLSMYTTTYVLKYMTPSEFAEQYRQDPEGAIPDIGMDMCE